MPNRSASSGPVSAVLAVLLLGAALPVSAQVDILWQASVDDVTTVETGPDGSVTVSGEPGITRLSPGGDLLWFTPRPNPTVATDIALGPEGEVYAVSVVDPGRDMFLYRLDADGTLAWSHAYDGPNTGGTFQEWDTPKAVLVTSTGTVVTVSESGFASNPGKTLWVQGHAPDGTPLWSQSYGTQSESGDFPYATRAAVDCAGNVVVVGQFDPSSSSRGHSGFVVTFGTDGTPIAERRLSLAHNPGEAADIWLNEVATDCSTGAVYVAGMRVTSTAVDGLRHSAFVARYDGTSDTETWLASPFTGQSGRGNSSTSGVQNLALGGDGAIYASAEAGDSPQSTTRVEVVRLTADGTTAWLQTRTGTNIRVSRPSVADAEGVTVITTTTNPGTTHYESFAPDGVLQWAIDRVDDSTNGPVNGAESMATHPDGGVVWLEGSFNFSNGTVVRAGFPVPTATVQVTHASAVLALFGPIEIYLNQPATSATPDATVGFRGGSAFLRIPAGETLQVRARLRDGSPLPGLPSEYAFEAPPVSPGHYVISITGIPEPLLSQYAANPQRLSLLLNLAAAYVGILQGGSGGLGSADLGGGVPVVVTNGVTDAPALDVVVAETGQVLADDLSYGEAAPPVSLAPGTYRVEVRDASDQALLEAVRFTIEGTESLFSLSLTGFLDPSANQNGPGLTLTATDETGATDSGVVVTGTESRAPPGYALASPNPARPGAALRVVVPGPGPIRLAVLDALGREVAVLAEGERAAGTHTVVLPSGLAPGAYVLRLTTTGGPLTRRLIVLR